MASLNFVEPVKKEKIFFEEGAVYNFLCTLHCINQELDGLVGWIPEIRKSLSGKMMDDVDIYSIAAVPFARENEKSIDDFFSYLRGIDPEDISRKEYELWADRAELIFPNRVIPAFEVLAEDKSAYFDFGKELYGAAGLTCCENFSERSYEKYSNPVKFRDDMVAFLEYFWNEYYAKEWDRVSSDIRRSVQAFQSLNYSKKNLSRSMKEIIERDEIPESFEGFLDKNLNIVFIPSVHIGPYLLGIYHSDTTVKIMIRARMPEGASVRDLEMERSDVYSQLAGLADNTRLQILRMASDGRFVTTQIVIDKLGLSQSSASRHLNQLTAAGFLSINPQERVKQYRLNNQKIDSTFKLLKDFLKH